MASVLAYARHTRVSTYQITMPCQGRRKRGAGVQYVQSISSRQYFHPHMNNDMFSVSILEPYP